MTDPHVVVIQESWIKSYFIVHRDKLKIVRSEADFLDFARCRTPKYSLEHE